MSYDNVDSIRCRFQDNQLHCDVTMEPDGPQKYTRSPAVVDEVDVNDLTADTERYTGKGIQYDFSDESPVSCTLEDEDGGEVLDCDKRQRR